MFAQPDAVVFSPNMLFHRERESALRRTGGTCSESWGSFMIARSLSYPGLGGVGAGANSCSCSWKAELRANDPRTKLTSVSLRVCTPKPGASDPVFSTTSPTFSPWPEDPLYQNPAGASGTGCPTLGGKWKSPEVSQAGTKNSDPTLKLVCHIKIT